MSLIYSGLTSIFNKISDELRKSFLFTTIFSILEFIEDQWLNSYFKRFYPDENFLNFLNKNIILKEHIFNPLIVLFLFAMFLILTLNSPSTSLVITLIIAFVGFFIGSAIIAMHIPIREVVHFNRKDIYSIGFCLMLISIIFFF